MLGEWLKMEKNNSIKILQNLRFGNIKERSGLINCVDGKVHSISNELIEALDEAIEMLVEKEKGKLDNVKSDEEIRFLKAEKNELLEWLDKEIKLINNSKEYEKSLTQYGIKGRVERLRVLKEVRGVITK